MDPSPPLEHIGLEDNWIGEEGAAALGRAVEAETLSVNELILVGNPAIPMPTRQRLKLTQSAGAHRLCLWAFAEDEARSIDQHSPFGRLAGGG